MGLDTSHNCWHGSYLWFHNFRKKICEVSGYGNLDDRTGFSEDRPGIPWPGSDPIEKLLHHSDCDGEIEWEHCEAIASSIEKLIPALEKDCADPWYAERAKQFANGLRVAAAKKENVDFH